MTEVKEAPKPKAQNGPSQTKEITPQATTAPLARTVNPFMFLRRFAQDMDQLFEGIGLETGFHVPRLLSRGHEMLRREAGFVPAEWSPRVDVMERGGQFVVRADLPGLSKDDVKVEVSDNMLTIQGERKQEKKEEREGCCYSECSYGSFYRAIPLPEGTDGSKATADFRKGVLEVTMPSPRQPEPKVRSVEVNEQT
jgi:HSP20 family protein